MFSYLIDIEKSEREKFSKNEKQYSEELRFYEKNMKETNMQPNYYTPNYYMAQAIKLVATIQVERERAKHQTGFFESKARIINPDYEINDWDATKWLWTATVFLGSILPDKKFTHDEVAIPKKSATLQTEFVDLSKTEIGIVSLFSKKSVFERYFQRNLDKDKIEKYLNDSTQEEVRKKRTELYQKEENLRLKQEQEKIRLQKEEERIRLEKKREEDERLEKEKRILEEKERIQKERKRKEQIRKASKELIYLCSFKKGTISLDKIRNQILLGADIDSQFQREAEDQVRLQNEPDIDGTTALIVAIERYNEEIAEYLINHGANPEIRNKDGESAIDLVSRSSPLYKIMLQKVEESKLNKLSSNEKNSILMLKHINSDKVHARQIDEYLQQGADINYADRTGFTALMFAVDADNVRIVEYLLKCGADPFLKNKIGKTARDYAAKSSKIYKILKDNELLISAPSSESKRYLEKLFSESTELAQIPRNVISSEQHEHAIAQIWEDDTDFINNLIALCSDNVEHGYSIASRYLNNNALQLASISYAVSIDLDTNSDRKIEMQKKFEGVLNSGNLSASNFNELGKLFLTPNKINHYGIAKLFFTKATKFGFGESYYFLGDMCQHGRGVTINLIEAIRLFQLALNNGYNLAENKINEIQESDKTTPSELNQIAEMYRVQSNKSSHSYLQAISLFTKADVRGDQQSSFKLGQLFQVNNGTVEKDVPQAFKYYLKAAKTGNSEALTTLERLGEEVSAECQLELSELYKTTIIDTEKENYWYMKAMEVIKPETKPIGIAQK